MKLKVLGSGSSGNCYILENDEEALIIEAGLPFMEVKKSLNFNVMKIKAVITTHIHSDHHQYFFQYVRAGIPVWEPFKLIDGNILQFGKEIGLVEVMDDGALYMSQLETMVGSESGSAARMRKMRAKKSEKSLCDKNVTTEKEIEKDKELDKEKENTKASELVSDFDFNVEEAWEFTIKEYPKKTSLTSAKIIWMDKLLEVIEPNRKAVGKLIYEATRV